MARWMLVLLLLRACLALPIQAGPVVAKPEDVGLSSERLARIHEAVQRHLDAKAIAGAVTLVARNGRVAHLEAHGLIDLESKRPMPKDGIFRLASMSKPITAVAVMMLLEEGKVRLSDPVWRFIPEFKGAKVAVAKGGAEPPAPTGGRGGRGAAPVDVDLVPATREITVRDLLTHGSGLMSGGLGNQRAGAAATRAEGDTLATYIPKLGSVPLDFQPARCGDTAGLPASTSSVASLRSHRACRSTNSSSSVCSIRSA